VIFV
jgi:hypothetical protein